MKKTIQIQGMTCKHCAARVEKALNTLPGIKAKVDLAKNAASIETEGLTSDADIAQAVSEAGYSVKD